MVSGEKWHAKPPSSRDRHITFDQILCGFWRFGLSKKCLKLKVVVGTLFTFRQMTFYVSALLIEMSKVFWTLRESARAPNILIADIKEVLSIFGVSTPAPPQDLSPLLTFRHFWAFSQGTPLVWYAKKWGSVPFFRTSACGFIQFIHDFQDLSDIS